MGKVFGRERVLIRGLRNRGSCWWRGVSRGILRLSRFDPALLSLCFSIDLSNPTSDLIWSLSLSLSNCWIERCLFWKVEVVSSCSCEDRTDFGLSGFGLLSRLERKVIAMKNYSIPLWYRSRDAAKHSGAKWVSNDIRPSFQHERFRLNQSSYKFKPSISRSRFEPSIAEINDLIGHLAASPNPVVPLHSTSVTFFITHYGGVQRKMCGSHRNVW